MSNFRSTKFSLLTTTALAMKPEIAVQTGVKIVHETHRGRFSYHAASLIPYLERFPDLEINADFSHFCTVSESLLEDQENILAKIIPHALYIHASPALYPKASCQPMGY